MALASLSTVRLSLLPWGEDDIGALHQLWVDPDVRRYLWDDLAISREQAVEAVQSHLASVARHGFGFWSIRLVGACEIIGFCGFRPAGGGRDVELLYGLLPAYWGLGLATEAARAALDYFWSHTAYQRVLARADAPNAKSIHVMQRLGMRPLQTNESPVTYVLERPGAPPS